MDFIHRALVIPSYDIQALSKGALRSDYLHRPILSKRPTWEIDHAEIWTWVSQFRSSTTSQNSHYEINEAALEIKSETLLIQTDIFI